MKKLICLLSICLTLACIGCQSNDYRLELVIENTPAPFTGYNIGQSLYVREGEPVPVTGALLWINGLEPNDIMGVYDE